jgi:putative transposase
MPRPIRYIPAGALVEVTTRTIQSRFLLRPSAKVNSLVLGVLGRAQELFDVRIHAFVFLSNHWHGLMTVRDAFQLARFMSFVNGNIAREVGRVRGWRQRFWGRRYRAIVVADEDAQVDRLRYILRNGCKEGLVDRPVDWPGVSCVAALTSRSKLRGTWHDRTAAYHARRRGEPSGVRRFAKRYEVRLSPLPCWRKLTRVQRRETCARLIGAIEAARIEEIRRTGRASVGVEFILKLKSYQKPSSETWKPAPKVHASCKAVRKAFISAYHAFRDVFRAAAQLLKKRKTGAVFPEGSFPPRGPFVRFTLAAKLAEAPRAPVPAPTV